ncbi:MAG: DEAD/DEAH box helicase [archaeon]|jgi:helicase
MPEINIISTILKTNDYLSLNPVQEKASKHIGENLLVCAPTASGKTTIFEMFLLDFAIGKKKKVIYISPLKALTFEHYNDFKKKYSKKFDLKFGISTGDLDSSSKNLSNYDVLFLTFEKFDSVLRHEPEWIKDIGCVCIDEIHELGSDRGTTLEILITQLKVNFKGIVFLGLSATIGNSESLAKWLGAKLITSSYRPIPLEIGINYGNDVFFEERKVELENSMKDDSLGNIINDTLKQNKQLIVFCNSRSNTMSFSSKYKDIVRKYLKTEETEELRKIARTAGDALETPTKQCLSLYSALLDGIAFHNAGLIYKQREIIEEEFKKGKIRIIFATPTLAAGINLPAYRVVITTVYRFSNGSMVLIPVNEFHQMTGRAGRPKYDKKGEAIVIVNKEADVQRVYNSYVIAPPTDIESQLSKINNLRTQLLSILLINNIKTIKEMMEYISKTFYYFVFGNDLQIEINVREIINEFENYGFLEKKDENIKLTETGKKVCLLYVDPLSANNIIKDLEIKSKLKSIEELVKLFTVANTTELYPYLKVKKEQEDIVFDIFEDIKEMINFDYEDIRLLEKLTLAQMLVDWINEIPENRIIEKYNTTPGQLQDLIHKATWINHCIQELIKTTKSNIKLYKEYSDLEIQLKYGIRKELLSLVELKNIGRVRARKLFESGITGIGEIKKRPDKFLSVVGRIGLDTLKELKIDYTVEYIENKKKEPKKIHEY